MGDVNYFGNTAFRWMSGGELTTDKKGLVTGRMVGQVKPEAWADMPSVFSAHPYASFCVMEKRTVRFVRGWWQVYCDYVGCETDESEPVYDFNPGVGQESITLHPDFTTKMGGKPSDVLNGAIFRDANGVKTEDDELGVFDRFKLLKDDNVTKNPWAGAEEYLQVNNTIYTKAWTRRSKPADANRPLQVVDTPPGGKAPNYSTGNYKWLQFPPSFTQRGHVFDCHQQWMLSGPRGWNRVIYNDAAQP